VVATRRLGADLDDVRAWWDAVSSGRGAIAVQVPRASGRGAIVLAAYEMARETLPGLKLVVVTSGLRRAFRWRDHLVLSGFPKAHSQVVADEVAPPGDEWLARVVTRFAWSGSILDGDAPTLLALDVTSDDDEPPIQDHGSVYVLRLRQSDERPVEPQVRLPRRRVAASPHLTGHLHELAEVVGGRSSVPAFRERCLGEENEFLVSVSSYYSGFRQRLVMRALALSIEEHRAEVAGLGGRSGPKWKHVNFPRQVERVPDALAAFFPSGTLAEAPLVVEATPTPGGGPGLFVYSRDENHATAQQALTRIEEEAWGRHNPYRGHYLRVLPGGAPGQIDVVAAAPPTDDRSDLVLPDRIWEEIDANIHGLFARRGILAELELGLNRGVLLVGRPGTGKTQLCRVVASEVLGEVTVMVADPKATTFEFSALYRAAERFAPTLLVIEDIDVIVGRRGSRPSATLTAFLVELDGAMTAHNGVVTLATTNNPEGIDAAARRAARFDRIIEFPMPSRRAREVILHRYLRGLAERVDVRGAAVATEGASGADLRELVRMAVLRFGREVSSERLIQLARQSNWRSLPQGQYL
jgi:cell division protease FtsH